MNKKVLIGFGILTLTVILFMTIDRGSVTGNSVGGVSETDLISIPLSQITEKAQWYEYDSDGTKIKYFIVKAKDGSVKTAFDACDVCHASKKGYRQEGDDMICNNCGNYYPISGLGTKNTKGGGCWPGYLPNEVEGDNLLIKTSDLEKGEYRF